MTIECIYLDMDGVIADFVTPSLGAACIPLTHDQVENWNYFEPYMTEEEFWKHINNCKDFWINIKPYEWAHELHRICKNVAPVYFCSSPSLHHVSASEKIAWLRKHGFMGKDEDNYILTRHKEMLASPQRILIDDSDRNVDKFRNAGGMAITFPQKYNKQSLYSYEADRTAYVYYGLHEKQKTAKTQPELKPSNPKDNIGSKKAGLSAVPCAPLYEAGAVLSYGGMKYGRHNWRHIGVRASVYYDAALRHLMSWWEGENTDESGLPHLAHAIAGLMVYRDAEIQGMTTDDRPISTGNPSERLTDAMATIRDRFPEPVPPFTQKPL